MIDREKMKERHRRWSRAHPERANAIMRRASQKYKAAHREEIKKRERQRRLARQDDPEYRRKKAAQSAAWRRADPERAKRSERVARLKTRFGITEQQFEVMVRLQGGGCAICGKAPKSRRLAVEHDHVTGRVRGAVCHFCNRYRIANNNVTTARRVLEYLESAFDARTL